MPAESPQAPQLMQAIYWRSSSISSSFGTNQVSTVSHFPLGESRQQVVAAAAVVAFNTKTLPGGFLGYPSGGTIVLQFESMLYDVKVHFLGCDNVLFYYMM